MRKVFLMLLAALLLGAITVAAQTTDEDEPNPNAVITWPPPVYVLRGTVEIRGTADLPEMSNYFVEYRQIGDDFQADEDTAVFFPAFIPTTEPVVDDVLGEWDTTLADDGLYEIRLTVQVAGEDPVTHTVSPLRVENQPPPFVILDVPAEDEVPAATEAAAVDTQATLEPTPIPPTATPSAPRVTVELYDSINVRRGDGTNYPAFNALYNGESADIVGISTTGSGWFQIRLANGQVGWVSPQVVTVSGDISGVPRVAPPPPPPPTATPLPPLPTLAPATAAPATQINLVAGNVYIDTNPLVCAQTASIGIDVANLGSQNMTTGGVVRLQDIRTSDGSVQASTEGAFGPIAAGQTVRVDMRLTVSTFYNEGHRLVLTIDPNNAFLETVEGDNQRTVEYTLQRGSCP